MDQAPAFFAAAPSRAFVQSRADERGQLSDQHDGEFKVATTTGAMIQQHCGKQLFAVDDAGFADDRRASDSSKAEETESWWWARQGSNL
jgi:hypothetical protein